MSLPEQSEKDTCTGGMHNASLLMEKWYSAEFQSLNKMR